MVRNITCEPQEDFGGDVVNEFVVELSPRCGERMTECTIQSLAQNVWIVLNTKQMSTISREGSFSRHFGFKNKTWEKKNYLYS